MIANGSVVGAVTLIGSQVQVPTITANPRPATSRIVPIGLPGTRVDRKAPMPPNVRGTAVYVISERTDCSTITRLATKTTSANAKMPQATMARTR